MKLKSNLYVRRANIFLILDTVVCDAWQLP